MTISVVEWLLEWMTVDLCDQWLAGISLDELRMRMEEAGSRIDRPSKRIDSTVVFTSI